MAKQNNKDDQIKEINPMKFLIIILIIFLGFCNTSKGQPTRSDSSFTSGIPYEIIFDHLMEKEGLSHNMVTSMIRDREGILWIGTQSGLNRYDGKRIEIFRNKKGDAGTLKQNLIIDMTLDSAGDIWCGTEDGIICYRKKTNTFIPYFIKKSGHIPRIDCVVSDNNGKIWGGGSHGLSKLDPATKKFTPISFKSGETNGLPDHVVNKNCMVFDQKNNGLWVGTSKGMAFIDISSEKITSVLNSSAKEIFNAHWISALHLSSGGMLWFYDNTIREIIGYNTIKHKIEYKIPLKNILKDPFGGFIFETSNHELWFSSNSYETIRLHYRKGMTYEIIKNDIANPASVAGDLICAAFEDEDQTVWLGTIAGVSRYNHKKVFYRNVKASNIYPELKENWKFTCITENPNATEWWMGSRSNKIYIFNYNTGVWNILDLTTFPKEKNATYLTDIEFIGDDVVLCFAGAATYQYNQKTKKFAAFKALNGKFKEYKTRVIVQETDSTYLFGNSLPLLRWNKNTNRIQELKYFKTFDKNKVKYDAGWLNASKNKGAWLALSNQDLGYIHPGDSIVYPVSLPVGQNVFRGGYINSLHVDKNGDAWFTYSSQGLYHVKKKKTAVKSSDDCELKQWTMSDGLVNDILLSAVSDNQGNIWCASFNKFSIFDSKNNRFRNIKIQQSENNPFYYNYMIPLSNGNILTNIRGDIVEFDPSRIQVSKPKNPVILSTLSLPERKIFLDHISEVTLQPDENFIKIGFGSLSVPAFTDYSFEYKLDGINENWILTNENTEVSYTNLPPGSYTFRLRSVSSEFDWKSKEKSLIIIIKAPFYKTWWFQIMVFGSLLTILFFGIRYRWNNIRNINILKTKAQLLEKEKTTVMYENLKQHLNPHFLFNSLTSLSSLIRIDQKQAGDFLDKMSKVYRYILRNKDNETVPLSEELNFVNMYIQLQKTRFEAGLVVEQDIPEEYYYAKIVPVTLQNLIENAIKHNTADPENPLIIRLLIENDYLVVKNNLQKKNYVETSNKQGQISMVALYRFLSPLPVIITETETEYIVKIPLL